MKRNTTFNETVTEMKMGKLKILKFLVRLIGIRFRFQVFAWCPVHVLAQSIWGFELWLTGNKSKGWFFPTTCSICGTSFIRVPSSYFRRFFSLDK